MSRLLEGRVAVVTGAGNGIGRAEAISLAKHGAKVVVNDIGTSFDGKGTSREPADKVVREIKHIGHTAIPNYDSVALEDGAEKIIQAAIDNFGRIDILINNAGVQREGQNISDVSAVDWDILLKTHLYGTFFCTRRAGSFMIKQGYGRIVNTSSHVGLGWKHCAPYGAAKEGIIGFTRCVARDMAELGVTCNAIRPLALWRGEPAEPGPDMVDNRPEDVASLVAYLASEQAGHINGCFFEVWGGHVGIFTDPQPVQEVINKKGAWTAGELAELIPQTLTKGRSHQNFPKLIIPGF